jgi:ElaB/YqjD/DUF883 family membrane-anchored ribosome-binding protein
MALSRMREIRVNGIALQRWPAVANQLHRAEEEIASHPAIGLLIGAFVGVLLGLWMKRR